MSGGAAMIKTDRKPTIYIHAFFVMSLGLAVTLLTNLAPPGNAFAQAVRGPDVQRGNVPGDTLGNVSQSQMWRSIRNGVKGKVSIPDQNAGLLVQSEGDNFRAMRNGPLSSFGAWGMLVTIALLAFYFIVHGRIRVEKGLSGKRILRFGGMERTGHWLLAISFIVLGITGLNMLYGRYVLLPLLGPETFAAFTSFGKWIHDYIAFAFMVGLLWIVVLWIKENFPNRHDLVWLAKGGGFIGKGVHVQAKKFNAGQKIVFWLVVLTGISLSLSGLSLLFPYQFPIFAKTFGILNIVGFDLNTDLQPVHEMQLAQMWHGIISLFMVVVIIAHIYIGTIGMEGSFSAMASGEVDENWAKEHHNLWVEEMEKETTPASTPAAE